jgi:hypothetical protein
MIGPEIPTQFLTNRSTTPNDDEAEEAGPSLPPSIGPEIPAAVQKRTPSADKQEDEDEDDYVPQLPPDLAAARNAPSGSSAKRVQGPSFPTGPPRPTYGSDDEDDDVGPMPLPAGVVLEEKDGVTEFLEKEERRRKQIEVRLLGLPFRTSFEAVKAGWA